MAIIHAHTWKLCLTWTKSGKLGCLEKNTMVWEALISGDYVLLKVLYLSSKPVYFFKSIAFNFGYKLSLITYYHQYNPDSTVLYKW